MKILVTGSVGTIGTPLVKELKKRGHTVYGIDLMHTAMNESEYKRCDIRSLFQLREVMSSFSPDIVFHLAAEFGRNNGEDYYDTLWTTNVVGTKNILVLQREHRFKLIFASSSEQYGELPDGTVYAEDTPNGRHFNDYAMTKWVNERQIINDAERFGTESMILRFFNAYGPGEHYHNYRSVVALFVYRLLHNLPITVYAGYHRVFMYIGDMVPTLANACEKFVPGGIYNVGGTDYREISALVDIIKSNIPETKSEVTLVSKEQMNITNKMPDITRARRDLSHDPVVGLEYGIAETVKWARQTYTK